MPEEVQKNRGGRPRKEKTVTISEVEYLRLTAASKAPVVPVDPDAAVPDRITQQIDRLFEIFMTDPPTPASLRAGAMWKKIVDERAPANAFNVSISITPHTIPDTSLKQIVIDAHPMFVTQIYEGLLERFKLHEAPHELLDTERCCKEQFEIWAEKAYAPGR